jgi:8-oxo-dGTP pyrophosphatase MutT (NUDIX family)
MLTQFQLENYDGAGFVFMTHDWKFIMVKDRTLSKWGMCKGHRDLIDDHYLDTAKREAFEELGLYDDDYNIVSEPFVFPGSPKIYIFHMAILTKPYETIDITKTDIAAIKIVTFDELLEQLETNDNNIYMRLFLAHIMGTFHISKPPTRPRRRVLFADHTFKPLEPFTLPDLPVESHTIALTVRTSPCMEDYDATDEEVVEFRKESPRIPSPRCSPMHMVRPLSRNSFATI